MLESPFEKLTPSISDYFRRHGLAPLSLGVEKHGSWEWTGFWSSDITKYVSVYLAEEPEALDLERSYVVEVWAGADNGQRYSRHRVTLFRVGTRHLAQEGFFDRLETYLDTAMTQAKAITVTDLSEAYFMPRPA